MSMDTPAQGKKPPQATKQPESTKSAPGAKAPAGPSAVPGIAARDGDVSSAKTPDGLDTRTIEDVLSASEFLPSDDVEGMRMLREAMIKDLAPRSIMARLLAENLADLELERRRYKEWSRAILRRGFLDKLKTRLAAASPPISKDEQQRILTLASVEPGNEANIASLDAMRSAGIWPGEVTAAAYQAKCEFVEVFDEQARQTEFRRRRLLVDFEKAQSRARALGSIIPDAELA